MLETGNGGTFGKWKLSPIISLDLFANLRDQAKKWKGLYLISMKTSNPSLPSTCWG